MVKDKSFEGSSSLKKVLTALIPDLTYDALEIQEGLSAARKWKEVTFEDRSEGEREKVYANLIEYCKLDTLAMVEIHNKLMELCA